MTTRFLSAFLLMFSVDLMAAEVWIGRPSSSYYFGQNLGQVMASQQNAARSKGEAQARIAQARQAFFAAKPNTPENEAAGRNFADALFGKDIFYLSLYVAEGVNEKSARRVHGLDLFTGGPLDGGIPSDGWFAFATWVDGVRASLGAPTNGQLLIVSSPDKLLQALRDNQKLYEKYRIKRDRQELNHGKSQDEADRWAEYARAKEEAAKARAPDGGAPLHKSEIKPFAPEVQFAKSYYLASSELRTLLAQSASSGQRMLHCSYGPLVTWEGKRGFDEYIFWYEQRPLTFMDIVRADNKKILMFVSNDAIRECPPTDKSAKEQRMASRLDAN
ncbi:hypothetical protein LPB260_16370 [Pseudomonas sp. LPB0260]|uniref:hypothetical protein n=1 Tax=Pseudomonas sp. LPB0260 TaxID=2614442 RepID=UPI0015C271E9|nr:hypothetical protein [Pseudomonas sp. LPB0260]QLC72354.1 hypothetical protein LPB260_01420 [Pseudomonas sp. LPB0260]QLC75131.1 hypothetical protein LPB260_16370 [Pseudomonas sp. LPB0260]